VLALGGEPDFRPSASEWIERARPHLRSDPARARGILDELHALRPGSPGDLIGQALVAEPAAARALLAEVLAAHPEYRGALAADPDLREFL
jgi:hypothetical protein